MCTKFKFATRESFANVTHNAAVMKRLTAICFVIALVVGVCEILDMRTPDNITVRKCQACEKQGVKLFRIPKSEVRKIFAQDLLIRDTDNHRLCKGCSENISPNIFTPPER